VKKFTPRKTRMGKKSPIGILKRRPNLYNEIINGNRKRVKVSVTKEGTIKVDKSTNSA